MQNTQFNIKKKSSEISYFDFKDVSSQLSTPNLDDEKRYTKNIPLSPFNKFLLQTKKIPDIQRSSKNIEEKNRKGKQIKKRKKSKYNTKKKINRVKFVYLWKKNIFKDIKNPKQILKEIQSILKQSNQS